ncbi:MAG: HDOD domain-containing protein, partial [Magnetococcales bacterium]|nr:HDOD domain-containing protein [Magnetococcales bacterium]NGZ26835.1 HDOD domain-containing protein [Magnetococcales bacterium]
SQDKRLEMLWRHTVTVAKSAEFIATWLNASISPEDAYMAGLFHDCAIPVLIKKFQIADTYFGGGSPAGELIRREEAACGTNHALVGGIMAKSWGMTREISQSIKYHHVTSLKEIDDDACHSMWFIVRVADFVAERVFWGGGLDNYEYLFNKLDTSSGYLNSMQIDQYTLEKIGVSGQMLNELINDMNDFITLDDADL